MIELCAGIVNFKFKDFKAAAEDLSSCVKVDKSNKSAHTYLVSPLCLLNTNTCRMNYVYMHLFEIVV